MAYKNEELSIDQSTLIHEELSFRHDFEVILDTDINHDLNVLNYNWYPLNDGAAPKDQPIASCLGLKWLGVPDSSDNKPTPLS